MPLHWGRRKKNTLHQLCLGWWPYLLQSKHHLSRVQKPCDLPLNWLIHRNPYNGLIPNAWCLGGKGAGPQPCFLKVMLQCKNWRNTLHQHARKFHANQDSKAFRACWLREALLRYLYRATHSGYQNTSSGPHYFVYAVKNGARSQHSD